MKSNSTMKLELTIVLLMLVAVVNAQSPKPAMLKKGEKIADFTITQSNGEKINISKIIGKSKYTLIDFWASWCKPCRQQFPKLKGLYDKFNRNGFNIVGVSIDANDADWKKALMEDQTPWVHGRDADKSVVNLFSVGLIPFYLLVDGRRNLIYASMFHSSELEQDIEKLLKESVN